MAMNARIVRHPATCFCLSPKQYFYLVLENTNRAAFFNALFNPLGRQKDQTEASSFGETNARLNSYKLNTEDSIRRAAQQQECIF